VFATLRALPSLTSPVRAHPLDTAAAHAPCTMSTFYNKYKRHELPTGWGVPAGSPKGTPVGVTLTEERQAEIMALAEETARKLVQYADDEERFPAGYGRAMVAWALLTDCPRRRVGCLSHALFGVADP